MVRKELVVMKFATTRSSFCQKIVGGNKKVARVLKI